MRLKLIYSLEPRNIITILKFFNFRLSFFRHCSLRFLRQRLFLLLIRWILAICFGPLLAFFDDDASTGQHMMVMVVVMLQMRYSFFTVGACFIWWAEWSVGNGGRTFVAVWASTLEVGRIRFLRVLQLLERPNWGLLWLEEPIRRFVRVLVAITRPGRLKSDLVVFDASFYPFLNLEPNLLCCWALLLDIWVAVDAVFWLQQCIPPCQWLAFSAKGLWAGLKPKCSEFLVDFVLYLLGEN